MLTRIGIAFCASIVLAAPSWGGEPTAPSVESRVLKTAAGERILEQRIELAADIDTVWKAYTTADGWTAWAAPKARIDLRVGGTILTQYDKSAAVGDPGTNTLHIVNYVPRAILTLRAELQPNWPELLQRDADKLTNVILFEKLGETRTRVVSYGIGYGDAPEYEELLQFFIRANEGLMEGLRGYVENGSRTTFP